MSTVNRKPLIDVVFQSLTASERMLVKSMLDSNATERHDYDLFHTNVLPENMSPRVQLATIRVKKDTIATGILCNVSAGFYYLVAYDKRPVCEIWEIKDNIASRTRDEGLTLLEVRYSLDKAAGFSADETLTYADAEFVHHVTADAFVSQIIGEVQFANELYYITEGNGTYPTGHTYLLDSTAVPQDITSASGVCIATGELTPIHLSTLDELRAYFSFEINGVSHIGILKPLATINHSPNSYTIDADIIIGMLGENDSVLQIVQINNCPCKAVISGQAKAAYTFEIQTTGAYFFENGTMFNTYTVAAGESFTFKGNFNSLVDKVLIL
jgi:hypothetical protein